MWQQKRLDCSPLFLLAFFVGEIIKSDGILGGKEIPVKRYASLTESTAVPSVTAVNKPLCLSKACGMAAFALWANLDTSFDPCTNFYMYACNGWRKSHTVPEERFIYTPSFHAVTDIVEARLRDVLAVSGASPLLGDSKAITVARMFYKNCVDSEKRTNVKSGPLRNLFSKMGVNWPNIVSKGNQNESIPLGDAMISVKRDFGIDIFWILKVEPDDHDVSRLNLILDQPDLTIGGARGYYLDAEKYGDIRASYRKWIADTARILVKDEIAAGGVKSFDQVELEAELSQLAEEILAFEIQIANITRPGIERRNLTAMFNLRTISELNELMPFMDWNAYFAEIAPVELRNGLSSMKVVVTEPLFFSRLTSTIAATDPDIVRSYFAWKVVVVLAQWLDQRFADAKQAFLKVLKNRSAEPAAWKLCASLTNDRLDKAVSGLYIAQFVTDDDIREANLLLQQLSSALQSLIFENRWMDENTKRIALHKLKNMAFLVGYSNISKDVQRLDEYYQQLTDVVTETDDYFEISRKVAVFLQRKTLQKLLKSTDRFEFTSSAAIVNAYYNFHENAIVLPAAILQPPFFSSQLPSYLNLGALGSIVGHEFTHAFDDRGSQYDATGNVEKWWSEQSAAAFQNRTKCIIDQYAAYQDQQTKMNINGIVTQGENIADNGGLIAAYKAYRTIIAATATGELPGIPGPGNATNDQTFFVAFASDWCSISKQAAQVQLLLSDVHSPAEFRVNGAVSNFDAFAQAFGCPAGSPMNPVKTEKTKCEIW